MRGHKILLLTIAVSLTGCDWLLGAPPAEKRDRPSWQEPMQNCDGKDTTKIVVECNPSGSRCECKDLVKRDGG